MSLRDHDDSAIREWCRGLEGESRSAPTGIVQGSVGYGAGGSPWLDLQHSKRAPGPMELVNEYTSVAFACMELNGNGVAANPLRLFCSTARGQKKLDGSRHRKLTGRHREHVAKVHRSLADPTLEVEELAEHPLLDAFADPNPYFDDETFLQYLVRCLDAVGSAYIRPERVADYCPHELWPLQPQYVYAVKGQGRDILKEWQYFSDRYRPGELVWLRFLSLRDPYLSGYAPLQACFEQIGLGRYYTGVVESILQNGARPSLLVSPKDKINPLGDVERRRLEAEINSKFTQGRQGKSIVTDGSIDVNSISFPPADLSSLKISEAAMALAANCFGVPISMLIDGADSTKAVSGEATHKHQYYAIAPRCRKLARQLTKFLARPIDNRLFFAFDDPVRRDRLTDVKVFDLEAKNRACTVNEYRAETGREPVAWGDEDPAEHAAKQAQAQAQAQAKNDPEGDDAKADAGQE